MRIVAALSLGSIVACHGLVNAANPPLTKKTPRRSLLIKELTETIHAEGTTSPLVKCSDSHGLKPGIQIKYLVVRLPNERRICDLIYDDEQKSPNSLLLLGQIDKGGVTEFPEFRFDLDGKLLSAAISTGVRDQNGKPVKGSLKEMPLDPTSKEVIASADKALEYWISGAYKKHLQAKKDGAAPETAKKPKESAVK